MQTNINYILANKYLSLTLLIQIMRKDQIPNACNPAFCKFFNWLIRDVLLTKFWCVCKCNYGWNIQFKHAPIFLFWDSTHSAIKDSDQEVLYIESQITEAMFFYRHTYQMKSRQCEQNVGCFRKVAINLCPFIWWTLRRITLWRLKGSSFSWNSLSCRSFLPLLRALRASPLDSPWKLGCRTKILNHVN